MQDPFYVVKEEVVQSVNGAKTLFARWQELCNSSTNTAQDAEFQWTSNELKKVIKNIEWDIQDLEETISIVEEDRGKFKIDPTELAERKKFVQEVQSGIRKIKEEVENPKIVRKLQQDNREALFALPNSKKSDQRPKTQREKLEEAIIEDNENFIKQEQMRIERLQEEEDEQLDYLSAGVTKLNEMSITIGDELDDQNQLLDDFQGEVEKTSNRISAGIKKISELIDQSSNRTSMMIIIALVVVLIFLLVVVFYI